MHTKPYLKFFKQKKKDQDQLVTIICYQQISNNIKYIHHIHNKSY